MLQCKFQKEDRKEVLALKKFMLKYSGMLAAFALVITSLTANSTCVFAIHQPVMSQYSSLPRRYYYYYTSSIFAGSSTYTPVVETIDFYERYVG